MSADVKGRGNGEPKLRDTSGAPDSHVANALRSAYEEAVQEDVPPEFLELLGKLT